jgi:hypothetical protein
MLQHLGRQGSTAPEPRQALRLLLLLASQVGSTAFGVDFQTLPDEASPSTDTPGGKLMTACQTILNSGGMAGTSVYIILNALFPGSPLVGWLALTFPDRALKELLKVMIHLCHQ